MAPPDMSSPRATLNSFLEEAVRLEALYSRSRAEKTFANVRAFVRQMEVLQGFFDLSAVPPAFRRKVGSRAAAELIDILVRLPPQDLNAAPGAPQYDPKQTPAYWVIPNTEIALAARDLTARTPASIASPPKCWDAFRSFTRAS